LALQSQDTLAVIEQTNHTRTALKNFAYNFLNCPLSEEIQSLQSGSTKTLKTMDSIQNISQTYGFKTQNLSPEAKTLLS